MIATVSSPQMPFQLVGGTQNKRPSIWLDACDLSKTHNVLAPEPDSRYIPSGENATLRTKSVCPWKSLLVTFPVSRLHRHIVLSPKPDAKSFLSGENAMDHTT